MNYREISVVLLYSMLFLIGCTQSPITTSVSAKTTTPEYRSTETTTYATLEEKNTLPNHWDGGLFSEIPCQAPCFAGINPGVTTENQIANIIQENNYFQNCTFEDKPNQGRRIFCNGLVISINKDNGLADGIGFSPLLAFTLEDVVSKYGEPTTVWFALLGIPEAPEFSMIVLFEDKKILVDLEDQEASTDMYLLVPSAKVTKIVYYSKENYGFTAYLQPWHGYGEYDVNDSWH